MAVEAFIPSYIGRRTKSFNAVRSACTMRAARVRACGTALAAG